MEIQISVVRRLINDVVTVFRENYLFITRMIDVHRGSGFRRGGCIYRGFKISGTFIDE